MKRSKLARRQDGRWLPLSPATPIAKSAEALLAMRDRVAKIAPNIEPHKIDTVLAAAMEEASEIWKNDRYQVHVIRWPAMNINGSERPIVQLSIRRLDRAPARDWRDFQRIKNQLIGPQCEAIELYPAEDRLVDTANQFHLWAVADPGFRFPFGYVARVVNDESFGGSVQRPLED